MVPDWRLGGWVIFDVINHLGRPIWSYPQGFVGIQINLAALSIFEHFEGGVQSWQLGKSREGDREGERERDMMCFIAFNFGLCNTHRAKWGYQSN